MFELWSVQKLGGAVAVQYWGLFANVGAAVKAAWEIGPGKYRVCDRNGEVTRLRVRERKAA